MKENLKVLNIDGATEWHEVKSLFFSLGFSSVISGLTLMFTDKQRLPCRDITLPELRELARPKEYLNSEFELVVTNQPDDGWRLVPDRAYCYAQQMADDNAIFFYAEKIDFLIFLACDGTWTRSSSESYEELHKILWQRENKVEAVKGRFLHQEWYEAFGRGEDVQFKLTNHSDNQWKTLSTHSTFEKFNENQYEFRLKPQTIQIGSRTINKPIGVKPEIGDIVYVANLTDIILCTEQKWNNSPLHIHLFDLGLLHKSKEDALNHSKAFLETMK